MIYGTQLAVSRENIEEDIRRLFNRWTDGTKHLISHNLQPMDVRKCAKFTGTDQELIEWVKQFPYKVGAIYVVSDSDVVYDMEELKPSLVFYRIVINDSINLKKQDTSKLRSSIESDIAA